MKPAAQPENPLNVAAETDPIHILNTRLRINAVEAPSTSLPVPPLSEAPQRESSNMRNKRVIYTLVTIRGYKTLECSKQVKTIFAAAANVSFLKVSLAGSRGCQITVK